MSGIVDKIKGAVKNLGDKLTGGEHAESSTAEGTSADADGAASEASAASSSGTDSLKSKAREMKASVASQVDRVAERAQLAKRRRAKRKLARGY